MLMTKPTQKKLTVHQFKNVDELVKQTTTTTFHLYWLEMKRHRRALTRIFAADPTHIHRPVKTGSVGQVWPKRRHIENFYHCEVCLCDLTQEQVKAIKAKEGVRPRSRNPSRKR